MTYLERIERTESKPIEPMEFSVGESPLVEPDFSQLEWSVIRLARGDGLSTIRRPGLARRVYNWVIGRTGNPRLANERLEALRRIAVLGWRFGYLVPGEEIAGFLSAGFTLEQFDLLVRSTRAPAAPSVTAEVVH